MPYETVRLAGSQRPAHPPFQRPAHTGGSRRPAHTAWDEAGGPHASINTMGMGLTSVEAHLELLAAAAEALRRG